MRRKILKEKCLLIHVSTHVHIKTRQTCNSFSLLPFQEDCLLFFALVYYSLLFLKFEGGGGATPVTPSRSANDVRSGLCMHPVHDKQLKHIIKHGRGRDSQNSRDQGSLRS